MGTKHEARGIAGRTTRGGEKLLTLAVSWRASAVRGEIAGLFPEVAGMSIVAVGCLGFTVDTRTVDSRVTTKNLNITT